MGVPLLAWKYRGKIIDQGLISGFLSALQMFAGKTRGQKIHVVFMDPELMVFEQTPTFTVVITVANREGLPLAEKIIQVLLPKFQERYQAELENFSGNLDPFQSFSRDLLSIVSGCGVPKISTFLIEQKKSPDLEQRISTLTVFDGNSGSILYRQGGNPGIRDQVEYLFSAIQKSGNEIANQLSGEDLKEIEILSDNNAQSSISRLAFVDVAFGRDPVTWLNLELVKDITNALKAGNDISRKIPEKKNHVALQASALEKTAGIISKTKQIDFVNLIGLFDSSGGIYQFQSEKQQYPKWANSIATLMRFWKALQVVSRQIHRSELDCVEFRTREDRFVLFSWNEIALLGSLNKSAPPFGESTKVISKSLTSVLAKKF